MRDNLDWLQSGGIEALEVAAALVGCDYNCERDDATAKKRGVDGLGDKKSTLLIRAMLDVFTEDSKREERSDAGFVKFAAQHFGSNGTADEGRFKQASSSAKVAATALRLIREHKRNALPASFADELRRVHGVFQSQRQLARTQARQYSRAQAVWTGRNMRRRQLMDFLTGIGIKNGEGTTGNALYLKVMALDVERTMRAGEAGQAPLLLNVHIISKIKDWHIAKVRFRESHCALHNRARVACTCASLSN